mmetsp:Transcript_34224/g.74083  ORF Transcript_34224/g.74083 Transcript_34224/m.74083 type:complete len:223 (-) Transcript_34224:434-1102(-)
MLLHLTSSYKSANICVGAIFATVSRYPCRGVLYRMADFSDKADAIDLAAVSPVFHAATVEPGVLYVASPANHKLLILFRRLSLSCPQLRLTFVNAYDPRAVGSFPHRVITTVSGFLIDGYIALRFLITSSNISSSVWSSASMAASPAMNPTSTGTFLNEVGLKNVVHLSALASSGVISSSQNLSLGQTTSLGLLHCIMHLFKRPNPMLSITSCFHSAMLPNP